MTTRSKPTIRGMAGTLLITAISADAAWALAGICLGFAYSSGNDTEEGRFKNRWVELQLAFNNSHTG